VIYVTVGTQLPFDRLVAAVDAWAEHADCEVFAQTATGRHLPQHCGHAPYVRPREADELFQRADLIVSHAGMGSIINAMRYRRPILILPRRVTLGEHRNDHQLATARAMEGRPGVFVAMDTANLCRLLDGRAKLGSGTGIDDFADPLLLSRLRAAVNC
jgi:UDP-N-acetylglucosamine transferase subunit ALG13